MRIQNFIFAPKLSYNEIFRPHILHFFDINFPTRRFFDNFRHPKI